MAQVMIFGAVADLVKERHVIEVEPVREVWIEAAQHQELPRDMVKVLDVQLAQLVVIEAEGDLVDAWENLPEVVDGGGEILERVGNHPAKLDHIQAADYLVDVDSGDRIVNQVIQRSLAPFDAVNGNAHIDVVVIGPIRNLARQGKAVGDNRYRCVTLQKVPANDADAFGDQREIEQAFPA